MHPRVFHSSVEERIISTGGDWSSELGRWLYHRVQDDLCISSATDMDQFRILAKETLWNVFTFAAGGEIVALLTSDRFARFARLSSVLYGSCGRWGHLVPSTILIRRSRMIEDMCVRHRSCATRLQSAVWCLMKHGYRYTHDNTCCSLWSAICRASTFTVDNSRRDEILMTSSLYNRLPTSNDSFFIHPQFQYLI